MKDMNEFRRTVYEKAEKIAAEEKARKLKTVKLSTFAACFVLIAIPVLAALGTSRQKNSEENFYNAGVGTSSTSETLVTECGGEKPSVAESTSTDIVDVAAETSQKYTTTTPYFSWETTIATSKAETAKIETTVVTTTPVFTNIDSAQTSTPHFPDTTKNGETVSAEAGDYADVEIGGKRVILEKGVTYAEICRLLGGEGEVARGSAAYRW